METISEFIEKHTKGVITARHAESVINHVVAGPQAVLDLHDRGRRVGAAILIDNCETEGNAAELTVATALPDPVVLDHILEWAKRRLVDTKRSNLDVPMWYPNLIPENWLLKKGFVVGYRTFKMRRESATVPEPRLPLPAGLAWRALDDALFESFYDVVRICFRDLPGAFVPPLDKFREKYAALEVPPEVLVDGDRIAGFVRIDPSAKEIAILGRHPDYRGQGLGDHVVARGLRMLVERKIAVQKLEVAGTNEKARALYERLGFFCKDEMKVYRRSALP